MGPRRDSSSGTDRLGGKAGQEELAHCRITAIQGLSEGTSDIYRLTSAARPKFKVVYHGPVWLWNMLNKMSFLSFWEACEPPTRGSQRKAGTKSIRCRALHLRLCDHRW